jgi:hypothetical protein
MECAGAHLLRGACIGPAVIRCGSCGALYYCSQKHQKAHWVEEHAEACARMAEQMQCAPILNDFPFSFTRQTTYMVDMGLVTACSFLESCGVHGQGLWKSVCDCRFAKIFGIGVEMEGWHLPSSLCPCKEPETPLEYFLTDWASYYEWRHLPLESPVALLLQWVFDLLILNGILLYHRERKNVPCLNAFLGFLSDLCLWSFISAAPFTVLCTVSSSI